ncbi:MAG: hypothetical protein L3J31_09025 [Bacteroidales bacterium]|nr:hypothetical protein [Bacteroidales bacterium]
MKHLIFALSFVFAFGLSGQISAQQTEKELNKEIKSKATRNARKEAKKLKKEGYKVDPGQLPMDKQLDESWQKRLMKDDDGQPAYFIATSTAVGETQAAAKMQAYELAKIDLARQIGTEIAGLVETNLANKQLNSEDAASVTETVAAFKSIVVSKMGRVLNVFEAYRTIDKNTEVRVTTAYSYETAVEMAKREIRKELESKAELNQEKVDELLDF